MKILFAALLALSACQTTTTLDKNYDDEVGQRLLPVLRECANEPDADQAFFRFATIDITISSKGFATLNAYRSYNEIPPKYAKCVENRLPATAFPFPGDKGYRYKREIDWSAVTEGRKLDFKNQVQQAIHNSRAKFRECAQSYRGKLVAKFQIDAQGKPAHITIDSKGNAGPNVETCVKTRLSELKLPKTDDDVWIEYPFTFLD